jgi:DNA-binding PadR family transcriptional regulator
VLSALVERPMHPYEMATVLRERGKDQDMKIKWGSLYTVVQNLDKHGFIAVTGSSRQGGRPERTVYEITDAGRAELTDWVRELVGTPVREQPRFEAGLSVLGVLHPDEAVTLLRQRLDRLDKEITGQRETLDRVAREVPRLFLVEAEYDIAIRTAEATWLRGFLTELTDGSFPEVAQWRAYHDATTATQPPGPGPDGGVAAPPPGP